MGPSRIEQRTEFGRGEGFDRLRRLAHLPDWLWVVCDSASVQEALTRAVPELRRGELKLSACKFKRAALTDGSWTMTYRVKIEDRLETKRELDLLGRLLLDGDDRAATPSNQGDFGTEHWRCYIPELRTELSTQPPDAALPALPLLTDADRARSLLEKAIRSHSPAYTDFKLSSCTPEVVHYKPGKRCAVTYDLQFPPGDQHEAWPTRVIAKTYDSTKGRQAYVAMRALWNSDLRTSRLVTIAEPLGFAHAPEMLVQASVPGDRSFKKVIRSNLASGDVRAIDSLTEIVHKIGRGLGELHTCRVDHGETITLQSELDALDSLIYRLHARVPEMAVSATPLVAQLRSAADRSRPDPTVPTHRSFRPAQVLVEESAIAFIDFDGFCQAEPSLDVALFRLTLRDLSLRALEKGNDSPSPEQLAAYNSRLDRLCALFLDGYQDIASVSRERLALWEASITLKEILDCWKKLKPEHLDRRVRMLHEHLETV